MLVDMLDKSFGEVSGERFGDRFGEMWGEEHEALKIASIQECFKSDSILWNSIN